MKSPHQLFHYLTVDPLNAATAEELASDCGLAVELAEPRDLPRLESQNALLILDWDYLPPEDRDRVLTSSALQVVAIHGFTVTDSVTRFLLRRGALCYMQLGQEMFRGLAGLPAAA